MTSYLEFEKPIAELETRIAALRDSATDGEIDIDAEVGRLQEKVDRQLRNVYGKLTPWQKTMVARHPERPHFKHYVAGLFDEFVPLSGDRAFADDQAIQGGFARKGDRRVVVIGHEKGDDTQSRLKHNFGMGKPEGYRKAIRLMDLADRFGLPVVTLIDTAGAFPGIQAEERGQAEAIARSIETCLGLTVPLVSLIIGEGGSGGAVAFATASRVAMLQHSVYSVISPEGCASILWKDAEKMREAAEALRLTAQDLMKLGVIDRVIEEPNGGAHRAAKVTIASVGRAIGAMLDELSGMDRAQILQDRRTKFLKMGERGLAA